MNISSASWKRYVDRREEALVRRTSPIKTAGTATVGANVFDPGAAPEDFDSLRNFLSTKLLNPELFFLDETISPDQMELEGTLLTLGHSRLMCRLRLLLRGFLRRDPKRGKQ